MTFRTTNLRFAILLAVLFAFSGAAYAQGPVEDTNTTTSELTMSAEVQTAVRLEVSGSGGATLDGSNSTGIFSFDFGNVNAFGLGTPATGASVSVNDDGNEALYKISITLKPVYSGFDTEKADIDVVQDSVGDADMAREGSAITLSSSAVSTSVPASVASAQDSGAEISREVGLYVARTELAGPKSVKLIYTITVE